MSDELMDALLGPKKNKPKHKKKVIRPKLKARLTSDRISEVLGASRIIPMPNFNPMLPFVPDLIQNDNSAVETPNFHSFVVSTNMYTTANALRENLERAQSVQGALNIDCGDLRQIGKTTTLKELIRERLNTDQDITVGICVPTQDMGRAYQDIKREFGDRFIIVTPRSSSRLRSRGNIDMYSDEISDVEAILEGMSNIRYLGGFYSTGV